MRTTILLEAILPHRYPGHDSATFRILRFITIRVRWNFISGSTAMPNDPVAWWCRSLVSPSLTAAVQTKPAAGVVNQYVLSERRTCGGQWCCHHTDVFNKHTGFPHSECAVRVVNVFTCTYWKELCFIHYPVRIQQVLYATGSTKEVLNRTATSYTETSSVMRSTNLRCRLPIQQKKTGKKHSGHGSNLLPFPHGQTIKLFLLLTICRTGAPIFTQVVLRVRHATIPNITGGGKTLLTNRRCKIFLPGERTDRPGWYHERQFVYMASTAAGCWAIKPAFPLQLKYLLEESGSLVKVLPVQAFLQKNYLPGMYCSSVSAENRHYWAGNGKGMLRGILKKMRMEIIFH